MGVFQFGSIGVKLNQITDGLFCTIMAGEKHVPLNQFGYGWLDSSTYNGTNHLTYTRAAGFGLGIARSNGPSF